MATPAPKAADPKAAAQPGAGLSSLLMLLVSAGAAAAFVVPAFAAFLLVALVPTAVAWIVETPEQRYLARTVGLLNLAGVASAGYAYVKGGVGMPGLAALLAQPTVWAMMYGAAAIGWGVYLTVPPLVVAFARRRIDRELRVLAIRRKQILLEWGPEAAGGPEEAAPPES